MKRYFPLLALTSILLLVAMILGVPAASAAEPGEIVINEIMQNPSAVGDGDGEWFELHNPTGSDIDIDGWTIKDDGIDTHLITNGGPLLIPAGGYLVLGNNADTATNGGVPVDYAYGSDWFLSNSADEVVLLDGGLIEIDRVEYDGGPIFPDPTGASMSLIDPALDNNVGANWCEASTPYGDGDLGTPGAANDCPVSLPQVVINEIMQNPSAVGDDAGEWFELYNPTGSDIDIEGWTIKDDGTDSHVIANGSPLLIPAGGYLVLGINAEFFTNGGAPVDYQYSGITLANGADEVVLLDVGSTEIDRVEYDGGPTFPDPNGASMSLSDPALDNNVGENWCEASTPYGAGDLGTPGASNDCSGPLPQIVINEIIQNPSAVYDSLGEWFELYNTGESDVDIEGWTIKDDDYDTHVIANGGPLLVPAGGYLVLGNNADSGTNGGVTVAYSYGSSWYLSNSGDEVVLLDDTLTEIDRVEYDGGPTFPDPTGASMSLSDPALDNNVGANWCTASTPFGDGDLGTPGAANDCPPPPPPIGLCGELATFIHEVQGPGFVSPIVGQIVTVEGVVVGDFEGSSELNGFNLQEEDTDADADPNTSEGVFIFNSGFGPGVFAGDVVRVRGTVSEYWGLTQVNQVTDMAVCSDPVSDTATPATVTLPVGSLDVWETVEGMQINIPQTLFASGNFTQGRYGEVDLSVDAPLDNPTNVVAPGTSAQNLAELNGRSRIQMDDGSTVSNPLPLPPYVGLDNTLRTGDTIPSLTGTIGYAFGVYEIHPTETVNFTRDNPRLDAPDVGGSIEVAAYNVLNYFTTLDDSGAICGPDGDQGCRGADNQFEFDRQKAKLVDAISQLDADIVGLMEIENYPGEVPIADLVDGINSVAGAGTYDYIATGAIGTDAIRVGILYKPASVTPEGAFAILDSSVDPDFNDEKNRPVLAQTFLENGTDDVVTVAVNHLKSKGSACDGDPDVGDGQGNCNLTRTTAAQALVDWLDTDPTGSGEGQYLITGDLNAYAMEDPVTTIEAGGYTDLFKAFAGTGWASSAYSYNFFSQSGYLDHGLSSPALLPRITGASFWHVNADEPSALNYNDFNQPLLFNPDEFRSSDHDPVVVGICETTAPVVMATASPDTLWPANHKYVDVSIVVDVTDADANPTITLLSVTSSEPDNGLGDGDTPDDIVIVDDLNFKLRAERSGTGDGRIYTITYEVTDDCGNSTTVSVQVTVPKSQGKGKRAAVSFLDAAAPSMLTSPVLDD